MNDSKPKAPTPGVLSVDSETLIRKLRDAEVGDVIPYDRINEWLGRDYRSSGALQTARRFLRNEHRMVFATLRGEGIKRLADREIVDGYITNRLKSIRRKARVTMRELACADYDALDSEGKLAHNTKVSILGALQLASSPQTVKKIEKKVQDAGEALPVARTLELFK